MKWLISFVLFLAFLPPVAAHAAPGSYDSPAWDNKECFQSAVRIDGVTYIHVVCVTQGG